MAGPGFEVAPSQAMADDTEDVELDFAADEQEGARTSSVIRCAAAGDALWKVNLLLTMETFALIM